MPDEEMTTDEILELYTEAQDTVAQLDREIRFKQQQQRYWLNRQARISEILPGMVQAEIIARKAFKSER